MQGDSIGLNLKYQKEVSFLFLEGGRILKNYHSFYLPHDLLTFGTLFPDTIIRLLIQLG